MSGPGFYGFTTECKFAKLDQGSKRGENVRKRFGCWEVAFLGAPVHTRDPLDPEHWPNMWLSLKSTIFLAHSKQPDRPENRAIAMFSFDPTVQWRMKKRQPESNWPSLTPGVGWSILRLLGENEFRLIRKDGPYLKLTIGSAHVDFFVSVRWLREGLSIAELSPSPGVIDRSSERVYSIGLALRP